MRQDEVKARLVLMHIVHSKALAIAAGVPVSLGPTVGVMNWSVEADRQFVRALSQHGHGQWPAMLAERALQPALRRVCNLPAMPEEGKPPLPVPAQGPQPHEPPPIPAPDVSGMEAAAAEAALQQHKQASEQQRQRHARAMTQWAATRVRTTDPADPLYGLRESDISRQQDFLRARAAALQSSLFAEAFPPHLQQLLRAEQSVRALPAIAAEAQALERLQRAPAAAPAAQGGADAAAPASPAAAAAGVGLGADTPLGAAVQSFSQLAQQAERARLESVRSSLPPSCARHCPSAFAPSLPHPTPVSRLL